MNSRLGKSRFNSLLIFLDYREISSILIGKHTQKLWNKNTNPVHWNTQGGEFQMKYTTNAEIILPELGEMKIMKWDFHVDNPKNNHRYDMILGHDMLSKLKIVLCLSE